MDNHEEEKETLIAQSNLTGGLAALAENWRLQAQYLRRQKDNTLVSAGISNAMRDYAVANYEDRADELMRVLAANE